MRICHIVNYGRDFYYQRKWATDNSLFVVILDPFFHTIDDRTVLFLKKVEDKIKEKGYNVILTDVGRFMKDIYKEFDYITERYPSAILRQIRREKPFIRVFSSYVMNIEYTKEDFKVNPRRINSYEFSYWNMYYHNTLSLGNFFLAKMRGIAKSVLSGVGHIERLNRNIDDIKTVYIMPENNYDSLGKTLSIIKPLKDRGFNVIVRVHPMTPYKYHEVFESFLNSGTDIMTDIDDYMDGYSVADIVINEGRSGAKWESLYLGIPTVVIKKNEFTDPLHKYAEESQIFVSIENTADIIKDIDNIFIKAKEGIEKGKELTDNLFSPFDKNALIRAINGEDDTSEINADFMKNMVPSLKNVLVVSDDKNNILSSYDVDVVKESDIRNVEEKYDYVVYIYKGCRITDGVIEPLLKGLRFADIILGRGILKNGASCGVDFVREDVSGYGIFAEDTIFDREFDLYVGIPYMFAVRRELFNKFLRYPSIIEGYFREGSNLRKRFIPVGVSIGVIVGDNVMKEIFDIYRKHYDIYKPLFEV